jgi:N-acetylglutamate synthase-like GNAT family acetyltransferase
MTQTSGESSTPAASEVSIRRATPEDQAIIRRLVYAAGLDRSSLHWSHFVVAELPSDDRHDHRIVGIGQIRPYRGCPELGSLVVRKPYRSLGIAGQIIRALQESHPPPLYLECLANMVPYYERFGFREIVWHTAPMPLSLKAGAGTLLRRLGWMRMRVAVMRWDGVELEL